MVVRAGERIGWAMTNIVRRESLGSGKPDRPERVGWAEGKAFRDDIAAEGAAVLHAYNEHASLRNLVTLVLRLVDSLGERFGHDPTRARLSCGWTKDGFLLVKPEWSLLADRGVDAGNDDQRIARLLQSRGVRGTMAGLLAHVTRYCGSKGIDPSTLDFCAQERSDGVGVEMWRRTATGRVRLGHGVDDVPW